MFLVLSLIMILLQPVGSCISVEERFAQYPGAPDLKLSVAEFPDDDIIPIGSNATIVCVSHRGDVKNINIAYLQPYRIPIYLYEKKIHQCGGRYGDVEDSKTCKYVIVNGTETNSGNYTCQSHIRLDSRCTEETITLTFKEPLAPRIVVHPPGQLNISSGQTVHIHCVATGIPRPAITWYKDGDPLVNITRKKSTSELTIASISRNDQGQYWCEATNKEGNQTSSATNLTVLWKPVFSASPADISVQQNANITLSCEATGFPHPVIEWLKNDKPIANASVVQHGNVSSLALYSVQADETAGRYSCVANNSEGETISKQGKLTILGQVAFYRHPESITTSRGATVKFTCSALGSPLPTITWIKNDSPLVESNTDVSQSNDTAVLSIWSVQERNLGRYWCVAVSSGRNGTSKSATLSLNDPKGGKDLVWIYVGAVVVVLLSLLIALIYFKQKRWTSATYKLNKEMIEMIERKEDFTAHLKEDIISQLRGHQLDNHSSQDHRPPDQDCHNDEDYTDHETYLKRMGIDRNWEIPRDRLTITNVKLGGGEFGIVNEGIYLRTNGSKMTVAVKSLKDQVNGTERQALLQELETLIRVGRHANIVSLVGACTFEEPLCVVIEFVPGGSLDKLLRHSRVKTSKYNPPYANIWSRMTERELLQIATDVANGMEHLESKQCVHRDLAARNVLIGKGLIAKVADFGMARDISSKGEYIKTTEGRIPWLWMSMEALRGTFTSKADVWSFGVVLWEIVTLGELPYKGVKGVVELYNELEKGLRLEKPPHCSEELYGIMLACWQAIPGERPAFRQLCETLSATLSTKERTYINVTFFEEQRVNECNTCKG